MGTQTMAQQFNDSAEVNTSFLVYCIVFIGIALFVLYYRKNQNNTVYKSSVLLSMFTTGLILESITKGQLANGLHYDLMITKPIPTAQQEGPMQFSDIDGNMSDSITMLVSQSQIMAHVGKILLTIALPTKHHLHVACLGVPDTQTRSSFDDEVAQYNLEPVTLEGDFPNYFSLYCSPGSQSTVRELLDPSTMVFLVDYCKKQDWELIDNMLYFGQNNSNKQSQEPSRVNNTTMVQDAEEFAEIVLSKLS